MPTLEPELARLVRQAVDDRLLDVHTCTLGKVSAVYAGHLVDVTLPIRRPVLVEDDSTTYEALPVLPKVPVMWPATNGTDYPLDVAVGDTVVVLFCEASIAEFWETGSASQPGDLSMHALSSAVAFPVARATATATDFAALASKVDSALNALASHTHSGVTTGTGVSGPPSPPLTFASVAATVTRAK